MESVWLELISDGAFGLVEVNFDDSERLRPDGKSLAHNRLLP